MATCTWTPLTGQVTAHLLRRQVTLGLLDWGPARWCPLKVGLRALRGREGDDIDHGVGWHVRVVALEPRDERSDVRAIRHLRLLSGQALKAVTIAGEDLPNDPGALRMILEDEDRGPDRNRIVPADRHC